MLLTAKSRSNFLATAVPLLLSGAITCFDLPLAPTATKAHAQFFGAKNEIRWYEDLAPAVQHATTNNLPLMLHFYGDNCPPCRVLERKAYKDPELIGKLNAQVVAVRINAEKNIDLRTRYNITRWPQDVYLLPDGTEIHRTVSPQDPAVYAKTIDRMSMLHQEWNLKNNLSAQANERRLANLTTTQQAYQNVNSQNMMANRNMPMAASQLNPRQAPNATLPPANLPSGLGMNQVNATTVSHQRNAQPPQTISFDNLPAPAVVFNPELQNEQSSTPTVAQATNAANELPTILTAPRMSNAGATTINNPFLATSTNANQTSQPTVVAASPISTANPMATTVANPYAAHNLNPEQQGTNEFAMTSSAPMHMASSPTQLVSSPQPSPQDIASTPSNPPADPSKEATVGLDGYCPVTLFMAVKGEIDQSECWTQGSPKFAVKHRGRIYLCASEAMRQRFLKGPDIYSPCLSGYDLIHYIKTQELIDGRCEFGCFQGDTGRIFLFANQQNSDEFRQKEAFYSRLVNTNQPERVANQPDMTPIR